MNGLETLVSNHPDILEDARGKGLMLGLKCKVTNGDLVNAAMDEGLLSVPAGDNVVRFVPPLIITSADVAEALEKLDAACSKLEKSAG